MTDICPGTDRPVMAPPELEPPPQPARKASAIASGRAEHERKGRERGVLGTGNGLRGAKDGIGGAIGRAGDARASGGSGASPKLRASALRDSVPGARGILALEAVQDR